ncbi:MAG: hypothetical protein K9L60_13885 [Methylovulum sp.]|nr:hypothetical protein [Methylovulum sp.]MCF8000040.1 hypothetical protein [Methylovulum sp.]MCF8007672.1 hypothetical protein [Methylovulum sp.]
MPQFVVASRPDGLGYRLMNLFHGLRYANARNLDFYIRWQKILPFYNTESPLSDFYDFSGLNLTVLEDHKHFKAMTATPGLHHISQKTRDPIPGDAPGYFFTQKRSSPLAGETYEYATEQARPISQNVKLNDKVNQAMEAICNLTPLKNYVAVHIRRGDIVADLGLYTIETERERALIFCQRFVDIASYINAISSLYPEQPLFIFSNDTTQVIELKNKLNVPVITVDNFVDELANLTLVQKDFIEMLLMSECRAIIGPSGSIFSGFAAFSGGIKKHPVQDWIIPEETILTIEKLYPNNSRVLSVIFEGYEHFYRESKKFDLASIFAERAKLHNLNEQKNPSEPPGIFPGININDSLKKSKVNAVDFRKRITEFKQDSPSIISEILPLITSGNYHSAQELLSVLEFKAGAIGAEELKNSASLLKTSMEQIRKAYDELTENYRVVIESIDKIQKT